MANPKVFSYAERGIKIENVNEGVPINVFVKRGIPVAFRIEQDTQYITKKIKIERNEKDAAIVKKEVSVNKEIINLLNSLKESMFSCDTTIYSFYEDGKIYTYDCMSNTNHFPYCDLIKISRSKKFHYQDDGFYIIDPVFSGYKKAEEVISFYDNFLKKNPTMKASDLFIMPQFPEFSSTTYKFKDVAIPPTSTFAAEDDLQDILDKIIKEEEEKNLPLLEEVNDVPLLTPPVEQEANVDMEVTRDGNRCSAKEYEATVSFVRNYIEKSKIIIYTEEKSLIEEFCLLFTIWSNKTKQNYIFNSLKIEFETPEKMGRALRLYPYETMAKAFIKNWEVYEKETISFAQKKKLFLITDFVKRVFKDELNFYLTCFNTTYQTYFGQSWKLSDLPVYP